MNETVIIDTVINGEMVRLEIKVHYLFHWERDESYESPYKEFDRFDISDWSHDSEELTDEDIEKWLKDVDNLESVKDEVLCI